MPLKRLANLKDNCYDMANYCQKVIYLFPWELLSLASVLELWGSILVAMGGPYNNVDCLGLSSNNYTIATMYCVLLLYRHYVSSLWYLLMRKCPLGNNQVATIIMATKIWATMHVRTAIFSVNITLNILFVCWYDSPLYLSYSLSSISLCTSVSMYPVYIY